MNQEDYLPISMLNQLEYCERRFYLMHVMGEMEVNAHVLAGRYIFCQMLLSLPSLGEWIEMPGKARNPAPPWIY